MNPELKKLNEEIKTQLATALGVSSMQETIAKIRAGSAEDLGTFEVIISTSAIDRQGESIKQEGWNLDFYKMNPVVLWAHDYYQMPIGVCDEIGVVDGKLVAKGRFAPAEANPFAQQVRKLYDAGMLRTTSVGFIAREMDGNEITSAELLEFSFVPVPANPQAVSLRRITELGLSPFMLATKGVNIEVKADPKEGDTCTIDGGGEGVMAMQDGQLVCVPKAVKAEGDVCQLEDGTDGVIDATGTCVAKPAEPAPAEEAEKAKGAISDELTAEQAYEAKWEKLDGVCEVLNALFDVYLDEATSADQFDALLTEAIGLLQGLVGTTAPTEASLNTGTVKALLGKAKNHFKDAEGAGTIEPPKGDETPKDDAVGETPEGAEGEETAGGQAPKERSKSAGSDLLAEIKTYGEAKAVLREVATVVTEALTRINASERKGRNKK